MSLCRGTSFQIISFGLICLINSVIRQINYYQNTGRGMSDVLTLPGPENLPALPPVIAGANTPEIERRVEDFFHAVAASSRPGSTGANPITRAGLIAAMSWPLSSSVVGPGLRILRSCCASPSSMCRHSGKTCWPTPRGPKTMNRRISSLSSFYRYLAGAAAELRLPITVPNPAHAQFISRESSDPVDETRALSETRARQLVGMPRRADSLLELRDRAILKFYLYTGARIATGCKLNVSDFHQDGDEATLRFQLKGGRHKTKGIHFSAAEAIAEYIKAAGIESGPLFRPRLSQAHELWPLGG